MTNALAMSFGQQLETLSKYIGANWAWPSPEVGFALHVFRSANDEVPFSAGNMSLTSVNMKRMDQAPVLASVGYALSLGEGLHDDGLQTTWAEGLMRLSNRKPFPSDRASFFYRPVELLGVSLGATNCHKARAADINWLRDVLTQGEQKLTGSELWPFFLGACASHVLSRPWHPRLIPQLDEMAVEELALLKWMSVAYQSLAESLGVAKRESEVEKALLERCAMMPLSAQDPSRAAVLHFSLRRTVLRIIESTYERNWQIGKDSKNAVDLITVICTRFHVFAKQLQSRHSNRLPVEVKNEYDVQDLMHALLRLHFDDVRPEEWTPSYAGNASRTDFLLKQEKTVIETKMTRKNLDQREVANQLIIDKERYKSHSDCKTLVCFVYDPEGRCQNPVALERDLSSDGDLRVVVIVAPKGA